MRRIENIIEKVVLTGMLSLFFGCGLNPGIIGETLDLLDGSVVSTYVTTTPDGAKLTLMNSDTGPAVAINTVFAPHVIHYPPLPVYGTYLLVSRSGYKTQTIYLSEEKEKIHVSLEREMEKKTQCPSLLAFSKAFTGTENLPDLSYVAEEASIPELINEALTQDKKYPPEDECLIEEKPLSRGKSVLVSIENMKVNSPSEVLPSTARIHITSQPEEAEFLLDEYLMGTTPMELSVQSGYHRIVLKKENYKTWTKQISIKEGRKKRIDVALAPSPTNIVSSIKADKEKKR